MRRPAVCYQFDDVSVDPEAFSVVKSGRALTIEPKSIRLLLYLVDNRSRAVPKEELLHNVWEDIAVTDNALARVVAQLRKGLGDDPKVPRYIETIPTVGYRFIADVVECAPAAVPMPAPPPQPPAPNSRWTLLAAAAFTLLAVLAGIDLLIRSRPDPPASWSGTVLGGPILASHPRISPDGQLLAFRAIVDGLSQVAVMKPESTSWTVLTHDRDKGAVTSIAWSHDGSKIYFDREWGPGHIYNIGALGGEPREVLDNAWIPEPLPDGSLIAQRHTSEGREQLIRFWPESGRTQILPVTTRYADSPNVRPFPDGREIAVFGFPAQTAGPQRPLVLDLQTSAIRPLVTEPDWVVRDPIAVSPDGRSVLVQRRRNDTVDTIALPRSGSGAPQTLLSLPGVISPISLDISLDGSFYMDHSHFERSILLMSPSGATRAEIPVPQLAEGGGERAAVPLLNGAVAFDVRRRGRSELFIGRAGSEPRLLLNTQEPAGLPGALIGTDRLAFILGDPSQPHIAIASLHDGSIVRRFPEDVRQITALTAPADGQTIYYASNGTIWAQPVAGGDARKIGLGHDIAIDPAGKNLYLLRAGADGYELFRMPAAGGEATRIDLAAGFNLTPLPLSPSAVDAAGRVLLPVNLLDVFFYRGAILDPARNTLTAVPAPAGMVVTGSGWTREGDIAMRVTRWSSSLWRYRISMQNKPSR